MARKSIAFVGADNDEYVWSFKDATVEWTDHNTVVVKGTLLSGRESGTERTVEWPRERILRITEA